MNEGKKINRRKRENGGEGWGMYNGPARAPRKPIMIIEWAHRRDVTRRRRGREGGEGGEGGKKGCHERAEEGLKKVVPPGIGANGARGGRAREERRK